MSNWDVMISQLGREDQGRCQSDWHYARSFNRNCLWCTDQALSESQPAVFRFLQKHPFILQTFIWCHSGFAQSCFSLTLLSRTSWQPAIRFACFESYYTCWPAAFFPGVPLHPPPRPQVIPQILSCSQLPFFSPGLCPHWVVSPRPNPLQGCPKQTVIHSSSALLTQETL